MGSNPKKMQTVIKALEKKQRHVGEPRVRVMVQNVS